MFTANLMGTIQSLSGRDIHGRHQLGPSTPCPFGPISLKIGTPTTTVRADSSASRGSANETVVERGKILIPAFIDVKNGSVFTYQGVKYEITAVHPRYSVTGLHDHWECDLESFVG